MHATPNVPPLVLSPPPPRRVLTAKGALPGSNGSDSRANATAAGETSGCVSGHHSPATLLRCCPAACEAHPTSRFDAQSFLPRPHSPAPLPPTLAGLIIVMAGNYLLFLSVCLFDDTPTPAAESKVGV